MSSLPLIHRIAREVHVVSRTACQICDRFMPLEFGEDGLGSLLYEVYYLGRSVEAAGHASGRLRTVYHLEDPDFSRRLRYANTGRGWTCAGWRIVARESATAWRVTDGDIELIAGAKELVKAGPIRVGARVGVRFPKHSPYRSPGFYLATGDSGEPRREKTMLRVYVNVAAVDAPALLRLLTRYIASASLRAVVKVLNNPSSFSRPDALVIYAEREQLERRLVGLQAVLAGFAARLDARIPGFTRRWLRGVGVAEQPEESGPAALSFGEHRTRLIAQGLLGLGRHRDPLERILAVLAGARLDPTALHLNPGSPELRLS